MEAWCFHAFGLDCEHPLAGHCIAGIDDQIHQNLLELATIGSNGIENRFAIQTQFNSIAEQSTKELLRLEDHVIEIEHYRLQNLSAAKGQQLSDKRRSAPA